MDEEPKPAVNRKPKKLVLMTKVKQEAKQVIETAAKEKKRRAVTLYKNQTNSNLVYGSQKLGFSMTHTLRRLLAFDTASQNDICVSLIDMAKQSGSVGLESKKFLFERIDGKMPDVSAIVKMTDDQLLQFVNNSLGLKYDKPPE